MTLKNPPNVMIFCLHVEEIIPFNVLKFRQFSYSGLAIIMGQKSAKIRFLFFADLYEVKMPYVRITKRKMHNSDFGGFLTHDNG